eukprot:12930312-Prorocentrum_lima.AAC.1
MPHDMSSSTFDEYVLVALESSDVSTEYSIRSPNLSGFLQVHVGLGVSLTPATHMSLYVHTTLGRCWTSSHEGR